MPQNRAEAAPLTSNKRTLVALAVAVAGWVALFLTYRLVHYLNLPGNVQLLADLNPGVEMIPGPAEAREQAADALRLLVPLAVIAWVTLVGLAVWLIVLVRRSRTQKAQNVAAQPPAA